MTLQSPTLKLGAAVSLACLLLLILASVALLASKLLSSYDPAVAVAAGIAPCVEEILEAHVMAGGAPVSLVLGSSGALSRQLAGGAPYEALLLSEERWPEWLHRRGEVEEPVVMARARLALWHPGETPLPLDPLPAPLAVPEPDTTAFGLLARRWLEDGGRWAPLEEAGVFRFTGTAPGAILAVETGAAKAALAPLSLANRAGGAATPIEGYHTNLVAALAPGSGPEATAFLEFCLSDAAAPIWERWTFTPVGAR